MSKRSLLVVTVVGLVACGAPAPVGSPGSSSSSDGRPSAAERAAMGKKMDAAQGSQRREELARQVDHHVSQTKRQTADVEDKLVSAARVALGEEKARGASEQVSIGKNLERLRGVGIRPRVAANPKKFQQGFLQLDGEAVTAAWKSVPQAKDAEMRRVVADLSGQTQTVTWAAYLASQQQIGLHLQAVAVTGAVVANRKKYDLQPGPEEVAIVKKALDEARRGDEIAAAGAGLSAALVAVTNGGKPAKSLEDMARAVKGSLPSKAAVTEDEAKAYLDGFEAGLGDARERYEAMLKQSYGEDWDRSTMKGMLDRAFAIADEATHQRSEAERRAERERRAEARRPTSGPASGSSTSNPANAAAGARGPDLAATAKSLLPSDGPVGGAVKVVDALRTGDAKGALVGAIAFAPPGPIKMGLNLIASLF